MSSEVSASQNSSNNNSSSLATAPSKGKDLSAFIHKLYQGFGNACESERQRFVTYVQRSPNIGALERISQKALRGLETTLQQEPNQEELQEESGLESAQSASEEGADFQALKDELAEEEAALAESCREATDYTSPDFYLAFSPLQGSGERIESDLFRYIFGIAEPSSEKLNEMAQYLQKDLPIEQDLITKIAKAQTLYQELKESCQVQSAPADAQKRLYELAEKQCAEFWQDFPAVEGSSKLFFVCACSGSRHSDLLQMVQGAFLKEDAKKAVQGNGEEAYALVKRRFLSDCRDLVNLHHLSKERFDAVLNSLKKYLPGFFFRGLGRAVEKDLEEVFCDLSSPLLAKEKAEEFWQIFQREGLEESLKKGFFEAFNLAKEQSHNIANSFENEVSKALPEFLRKSLIESKRLQNSHDDFVWLEIKKGELGFDLIVHAGKSLSDNGEQEELIFKNIEKETLNADFFFKMMSYYAFPKKGIVQSFSSLDVFKGLEMQLKKKPVRTKKSIKAATSDHAFAIFQNFLEKKLGLEKFQDRLFQNRMRALQDFCSQPQELRKDAQKRNYLKSALACYKKEILEKKDSLNFDEKKSACACIYHIQAILQDPLNESVTSASSVINSALEELQNCDLRFLEELGKDSIGSEVHVLLEELKRYRVPNKEALKEPEALPGTFTPYKAALKEAGNNFYQINAQLIKSVYQELQKIAKMRISPLHLTRRSLSLLSGLNWIWTLSLSSYALSLFLKRMIPACKDISPLKLRMLSLSMIIYGPIVVRPLVGKKNYQDLEKLYALSQEISNYFLHRIKVFGSKEIIKTSLGKEGLEISKKSVKKHLLCPLRLDELSFDTTVPDIPLTTIPSTSFRFQAARLQAPRQTETEQILIPKLSHPSHAHEIFVCVKESLDEYKKIAHQDQIFTNIQKIFKGDNLVYRQRIRELDIPWFDSSPFGDFITYRSRYKSSKAALEELRASAKDQLSYYHVSVKKTDISPSKILEALLVLFIEDLDKGADENPKRQSFSQELLETYSEQIKFAGLRDYDLAELYQILEPGDCQDKLQQFLKTKRRQIQAILFEIDSFLLEIPLPQDRESCAINAKLRSKELSAASSLQQFHPYQESARLIKQEKFWKGPTLRSRGDIMELMGIFHEFSKLFSYLSKTFDKPFVSLPDEPFVSRLGEPFDEICEEETLSLLLTNHFSIYLIQDFLAKEIDPWLKQFPANGLDFAFHLLGCPFHGSINPKRAAKIKEICQIFGFSPDQHIDLEQLQSAKRMFAATWQNRYLPDERIAINDKHSKLITHEYVVSAVKDSPEWLYYERLLKEDPDVFEKAQKIACESVEDPSKINDIVRLKILFEDSQDSENVNRIIPKSFLLLKGSFLNAIKTCSDYNTPDQMKGLTVKDSWLQRIFNLFFGEEVIFTSERLSKKNSQMQAFTEKALHENKFSLLQRALTSSTLCQQSICFSYTQIGEIQERAPWKEDVKCLSENPIPPAVFEDYLAFRKSIKDGRPVNSPAKLFSLISVQKDMQVSRALAFFQENSQLLANKRYRSLLQIYLLNALKAEVASHPDTRDTLKIFFKNMLESYKKQEFFLVRIDLIQTYMRLQKQLSTELYQIDAFLEKEEAALQITDPEFQEKLTKIFAVYAEMHLDREDSQKPGLALFHQAIFLFNPQRNDRFLTPQDRFHEESIILKNLALIIKKLDIDERFRSSLIESLRSRCSKQELLSRQWTGTYPNYSSNGEEQRLVQQKARYEEKKLIEEKLKGILDVQDLNGNIIKVSEKLYQCPAFGLDIIINNNTLSIQKTIEGTRCELIPKESMPASYQNTEHSFWKGSNGEVFALDQKSVERIPVQERAGNFYLFDRYEFCSFTERRLLKTDASKQEGLNILGQFYPLEQTTLYFDPANLSLAYIALEGLDLIFEITEKDGEKRAYLRQKTDYYLQRKQPLRDFCRLGKSLYLENEEGQEIVLIQAQEDALLGYKLLSEHFMQIKNPALLLQILSANRDTKDTKVYCYSCTKPQENDDAEALCYLLIHRFVEGQTRLCLEILDQIEDLSKKKALSKKAFYYLNLLALPNAFNKDEFSAEIFLRIVAIKEQNSLLFSSDKDEVHLALQFAFFLATQVKYGEFLENKSLGKYHSIKETQELFILHFLEKVALKLLKESTGSLISMKNIFSKYLNFEDLLKISVKSFGLQKSIYDRAAVLEETHRIRGTDTEKIFKGAFQIMQLQLPLVSRIPYLSRDPQLFQEIAFAALSVAMNRLANTYDLHIKPSFVLIEDVPTKAYDFVPDQDLPMYFLLYFRLSTGEKRAYWSPEQVQCFEAKRLEWLDCIKNWQGSVKSVEHQVLLTFLQLASNDSFQSVQSTALGKNHFGADILERTNVYHRILKYINYLIDNNLQVNPQKADWQVFLEIEGETSTDLESLKALKEKLSDFTKHYDPHIYSKSLLGTAKHCLLVEQFQNHSYKIIEAAGDFAVRKVENFARNLLFSQAAASITSAQTLYLGLQMLGRVSIRGNEAAQILSHQRENTNFSEALKEREDYFDKLIKNLLDKYFSQSQVLAPTEEKKALVCTQEITQESVKSRFEEICESLDQYYRREKLLSLDYHIKDPAELEAFQKELCALCQELEKLLEREKKYITDLVNQRRREELDPLATTVPYRLKNFEEIYKAFLLDDDWTILCQSPIKELETLKRRLYSFMQTKSRFALLFSTINKIQKTEMRVETAEKIAKEIAKKRVYSMDDPYLKAFLAFECGTQKLLWKKQLKQLKALLESPHKRTVLELIMGMGKTFFAIPTSGFIRANGETIVCNVFPESIAKANIDDTSLQAKRSFSQSSIYLEIDRNLLQASAEQCKALFLSVEQALKERMPINATKESFQSLELVFIELCLSKEAKEHKEKIYYLKETLKLLRNSGHGIIDESHIAFDIKKELCFPVGAEKTLPEDYKALMGEALLFCAQEKRIQKFLKFGESDYQAIDEKLFLAKIRPILAEKMAFSSIWTLEKTRREELASYFAGKSHTIPAFIEKHPKKKAIGLCKGLVNTLLPLCFQNIANVDFAFSITQSHIEYALPSQGNNNPIENSSIRNIFEAYIKTCILYLNKGLTRKQCLLLHDLLQKKAEREARENSCNIEDTKTALFYQTLCPDRKLSDAVDEKVLELLEKSAAASLSYVDLHVAKQMKYYQEHLISDPHNFDAIFREAHSCTGTPYNKPTLPLQTEVLIDEGTDGESIDLILRKCEDPASIQAIKQEEPYKVLEEMVEKIAQNKSVYAMIDRAASFRGIDNAFVAKKLLEGVRAKRPEIRACVFYDPKKGFVVLEEGSLDTVLLRQSTIAEHERLSYFDQARSYGADIPQKNDAQAIVSIGEEIQFNTLAQAIWRMRGLVRMQQGLILAITKNLRDKHFQKRLPTAREVISYAITQEAEKLAQDAFHAADRKMFNLVRKAVLAKMLDSDEESLIKICQHFKDLFIQEADVDPFKSFAGIERAEEPENVLEGLKNRYLKLLNNSYFTEAERLQIQTQMQEAKNGNFPKTVKNHSFQLNQTMQILQSQEQQEQQEQDMQEEEQMQEQEQMQELSSMYNADEKNKIANSIDWPEDLDMQTLYESLNPETASIFENFSMRPKPPVYSLQAVLERSSVKGFEDVFEDERILCSGNFAALRKPFSFQQNFKEGFGGKPLLEALILFHPNGKEWKVLLIDAKETSFFKQKIASMPKNPLAVATNISCTERRIQRSHHHPSRLQLHLPPRYILYNIPSGAIVASDSPLNPLKQEDFQASMAKLKFLSASQNYTQTELDLLVPWIVQHGHERMKDLFGQAYKNRMQGKDLEISGQIDRAFEEAERQEEAKEAEILAQAEREIAN